MSFVGYSFGCGGNKIPGWNCYDIEMDISKPLPINDCVADACFASHVCEHISGPQFLGFLTECHRILKPEGWMRLSIPVVGPWLYRSHARDLATGHGHLACYNEELLRTFFWMAGFDQQRISRVDRWEHDHHHKVIGEEKDAIETCRILAIA